MPSFSIFFSNDTATTEIYTLSLHDALPISIRIALLHAGQKVHTHLEMVGAGDDRRREPAGELIGDADADASETDRKSTRLNSSHEWISYAVFCLKKKKNYTNTTKILDTAQY